MTVDVGLSALLFIGFVSQWWVLLILVHVVADQSYKLTKGVAQFLVIVYLVFLFICSRALRSPPDLNSVPNMFAAL